MGISEGECPFRVKGMKKRRSYIFTNKKHSDKAIMSMILGIISTVSLGIVIFLTYRRGGEAKMGYGVTGVLATLFSLTGLALGLLTVREKENFRLFPVLGILFNMAALGILGLILYCGRM